MGAMKQLDRTKPLNNNNKHRRLSKRNIKKRPEVQMATNRTENLGRNIVWGILQEEKN